MFHTFPEFHSGSSDRNLKRTVCFQIVSRKLQGAIFYMGEERTYPSLEKNRSGGPFKGNAFLQILGNINFLGTPWPALTPLAFTKWRFKCIAFSCRSMGNIGQRLTDLCDSIMHVACKGGNPFIVVLCRFNCIASRCITMGNIGPRPTEPCDFIVHVTWKGGNTFIVVLCMA